MILLIWIIKKGRITQVMRLKFERLPVTWLVLKTIVVRLPSRLPGCPARWLWLRSFSFHLILDPIVIALRVKLTAVKFCWYIWYGWLHFPAYCSLAAHMLSNYPCEFLQGNTFSVIKKLFSTVGWAWGGYGMAQSFLAKLKDLTGNFTYANFLSSLKRLVIELKMFRYQKTNLMAFKKNEVITLFFKIWLRSRII